MENLTHYPVLVFAAAFVSLSLASETGAWLRGRYSGVSDERNEALNENGHGTFVANKRVRFCIDRDGRMLFGSVDLRHIHANHLEDRMPTSELVPLMRAQIAHSTILIASVLGSTLMATAQTGEFALQVPGSVVHRGWEIQDQLQDARSGTPARSVSHTAGSNEGSKSAKPAAGGARSNLGTKGKR